MNSVSRFTTICIKLIPPFIQFSLTRHDPTSKSFQQSLIHIREAFNSLGVTYIKLGQLLSARMDIAGPELSAELRKLLDAGRPIPFEQVQKIIETEFKKPVHEIFSHIDEKPISVASIAQVHIGKLKNGDKVAVKVQRPHLKQTINQDMKIFQQVATLLDLILGKSGLDFKYVSDEFNKWIMNELDFSIEARRAERFHENMSYTRDIVIPEVYWDYSTEHILVLSFIEGDTVNQLIAKMKEQNLSNLSELSYSFSIDQNILIRRTIDALTKQLVVDKFFHADLHPANLIVMEHNRVGMVDFGIVGSLDNDEQKKVIYMLLALVDEDPKLAIKVLLASTTTKLTDDQIKKLYQIFSSELHALHEEAAEKISVGHFMLTFLSAAKQCDIILTPGIILGAKTLIQLDAVSSLIGVKQPIIEFVRPAVDRYIFKAYTQGMTKERIYKDMYEFIEFQRKLPETLSELETLVLNQPINASISSPKNSSNKYLFLLFAIVILLLLFSPLGLNIFSERTALLLFIPLLFIVLLAKIL